MRWRLVFCGGIAAAACAVLVPGGHPLRADATDDRPRKVFAADDLKGTLLIDEPLPAGVSKVVNGQHQVRKVKVGDRVLVQFSYDPAKDPLTGIEVEYHLADPKVVECVDLFSSDDPVYSEKGEKPPAAKDRSLRYYVAVFKANGPGRCDLSILARTKSGMLKANPLLFNVEK